MKGVKFTPVVDGGGLKHTLERRVFDLAAPSLGGHRYRRALVMAGADRWGLATAVAEVADEVRFADLYCSLGIPVLVESLEALERVANLVLPVAGYLPASVLYPTGAGQKSDRHRAKFWEGVDLVAGDFHYIRANLPPSLRGVTVVTNTTTEEDMALLRSRGARTVVTTTPRYEGRTFGTNVLEAALTAHFGANRHLTDSEINTLIDHLGLLPDVCRMAE